MKGLLNWRVFSFLAISMLPLWYGIIACSYVMIKERIEEVWKEEKKEEERQ